MNLKIRYFLFYLATITIGNAFTQQNYLDVSDEVKAYVHEKELNEKGKSISKGTVGNGTLENGKLFPYKGKNFIYFDQESYLQGRAFLHENVRSSILKMYDSLAQIMPRRYFTVMECSNENGGKLFPHKTHQNGLSVDIMMPLLKDGKPYYGLDTIGIDHYALRFNDHGEYLKDPSIKIDFNLVARQLLILENFARRNGLRLKKVIIKIELKDQLLSSEYGKKLRESEIYIVKGLSPLINALHDDHFHVDFEFLN